MRLMLRLTAAFWLALVAFGADAYEVSPNGSDSNDCITAPCATLQRVADLCDKAACSVNVAAGVYRQATNIIYYKVIGFFGPTNADGTCVDRAAVLITDPVPDKPQAKALFTAQDHAIATFQCMTFASRQTGVIGIASRQYAIVDADYVNCGAFAGGMCFSANENSKINVYSPGILGPAANFVQAGHPGSMVTVAGDIVGNAPVFSDAMVSVILGALVTFAPATNAVENIGGYSYRCLAGYINGVANIPGMGEAPGSACVAAF